MDARAARDRRTRPERSLILIPIIHTEADLGGLAGRIRRASLQKLGPDAWTRNADVIGHMWIRIHRTVVAWNLTWEKVRLYQDGLPHCGREAEIVHELADAGSPNHQLLRELMKKGATLLGTESPDLLVQEYRLIREVLAAASPGDAARIQRRHAAESRSLLPRRDRYIAKRINQTLHPGEIGILFLGMLHSLEPHLPGDISVTYPISRPAAGRRVR